MQKLLKSTASHYKGIHSENIACAYFLQHGYEIIAKRYQSLAGEVDLICTHQQTLVFVEVKARATLNACLESISMRQQKRIIAAAEIFIADNFAQFQQYDVRFDVMAIDANGAINHLQNAFGNY